MNTNKKVFWWSMVFFVVSIAGIVGFSIQPKDNETVKLIFEIFKNIFISLVGGALISLVTSLVAFRQMKKQQEIKFYSEIKNLKELLKCLANLFVMDYSKIIYKLENEEKLSEEDRIEARKLIFDNSDIYVKKFVSVISAYKNYNYNEIYYILDDYCSLCLFRRNNKIRKQMYRIMREINNHNVLYDKQMSITMTLYEQGQVPEVAVYNDILTPMKSKIKNNSDIVTKTTDLLNAFMDMTKIDAYTKKLAVKDKDL